MKTLFAVLLLVIIPLASQGAPARVFSGVALDAIDGYAVTNSNLYSLDGSATVSVDLSTSNSAATTATTVFTADTSDDGVTWSSSGAIITITNAGTSVTSMTTNIVVGAAALWRVSVTYNNTSDTVTNFVTVILNKKRKI